MNGMLKTHVANLEEKIFGAARGYLLPLPHRHLPAIGDAGHNKV
jgi:hypothetical protein